jgi:Ca2+-binding EF-hand superfamily protein
VDGELLEELAVTTFFTRDEIRHLQRRFQALDVANRHALSTAELFQLPVLEHNQMRARLEALWAVELKSDIGFGDFVRLLSPFALGCPREAKFRFAFKVHDADGDGKIGESDLRGLIRSLLGISAEGRGGAETDLEAGSAAAPVRAPASRAFASRAASVAPARPSRWVSRIDARELDEQLIEKIMDNIYDEVDFDDDRTISFEEWVKVIANTDIVSKLTFNP